VPALISSRLFPVLLLLVAPVLAAQSPDPWSLLSRPRTLAPRPTTSAITTADLETRVYRFADDSMEGRILGSRGNFKGTEYIAAELRRMGLEPAGENGTYFQTLPMVSREVDTARTLTVAGATFAAWTDFVPRDNGPGTRSISGVPVVWGGDVSTTATRISPAQVAGKVVVFVATKPVQGNPPGVPARQEVSAAYRQAAGIVIVARDQLAADDIEDYKAPSELVLFDNPPAAPAYLYISNRMAEAVMGAPLGSLTIGAPGRPIQGDPTFKHTPIRYPARNVVAILRGSDPTLRNEFVAVGAHNDHVGMGAPVAHDSMYVLNHLYREQGADDPPPRVVDDVAQRVNTELAKIRRATGGASARRDSIFNGADDDASGSMAVLEIAERWAAESARPKRSILFVWHVGEEAGLFGSLWFTDHPTVPRDQIVAQLNIDMIGRGEAGDVTGQTLSGELIRGSDDYVQLIGSRRLSTQLGDAAEELRKSGSYGLRFDYSLDANGHPQNIYCRSDHYMYARYGIPVIFFTTGGHADYHQVTDEPQYLDYDHLARVTSFVADLTGRVANMTGRPLVDQPRPDPNGACRQ
jgi:hypothetical protein